MMYEEPISDEQVAAYLLGRLPEQEQTRLEDRAFRDPEFKQHVQAVEKDLIDEYVRGELSDSDREQFKARFLSSTRRRQKVAFARAFTGVVNKQAAAESLARAATQTIAKHSAETTISSFHCGARAFAGNHQRF